MDFGFTAPRRNARTLSLLGMALLAACRDEPPTVTADPLAAAPVASVLSTQPAVLLKIADTTTLRSPLTNWARRESKTLTWTSSSTRVFTINSAGFVTARDTGSAVAVAAAGPHRDTIPVVVSTLTVGSVTVVAGSTTLPVGGSTLATATVRDTRGQILTGVPVSWASRNTAVAAVGGNGTVSALSAGGAMIDATAGGVKGSVGITVTTVGPPPPPGVVALPTLPTLYNPSMPVVTGKQWFVRPGDNLQNALNQAQRGDEIVIQAGATFAGNFTLPAKSGTAANGWVIVRSEKLAQLPPPGSRVRPTNAPLMPTLRTMDQAPALATAPAASGWWIAGIEFAVNAAWTKQIYTIVALGDGGNKQHSLTQVPADIVLDRVYVHGEPASQLSRCIGLNSARTAIVDSYVHECHGKGFDSQAIQGSNGPGPFKIVNNTLAGAGENIMFGGSDPNIPNLIPSDIEIRRNYIYTPPSWKTVFTKKNLIETKNAQRLLIEGNVIEGSWMDGQQGVGVVFKSANQSGICVWCKTSDVTFRYNILRKAAQAIALTGREGSSPYPVGANLARVLFEHNLVDSLNYGIYVGDPRIILFVNNPSDVTIRRNTLTSVGPFSTFTTLASKPSVTNLAYDANIAMRGNYGFMGEAGAGMGTKALQNVVGTASFTSNVIIGTSNGVTYPTSTLFVSTMAQATAVPNVGANLTLVSQMTAGVIIP